ncbi:MAG: hypothetical protein E7167_05275 [Firmicutes bacterium]|nr:hypothetical protein [Bacillota bacterium]
MKKKVVKVIISVILSFILAYTLFIVEESIRLSNNSLAEPLIVFEESYSGSVGDATYKSLGFTLITKYAHFEGSSDRVYPIAQEFWLFDSFLIWAWVS